MPGGSEFRGQSTAPRWYQTASPSASDWNLGDGGVVRRRPPVLKHCANRPRLARDPSRGAFERTVGSKRKPCYLEALGAFMPREGPKPSIRPSPMPESQPRGDRKSTRLNSSHLGISYAVFCLK